MRIDERVVARALAGSRTMERPLIAAPGLGGRMVHVPLGADFKPCASTDT